MWYRDRVSMATIGPVAGLTDCSSPTTDATTLTFTIFPFIRDLHRAIIFRILSSGMLKVKSLTKI